MIWIAHRGNIYGPNKERENTEEYINEALKLGFDVEIDVWLINNEWYLGHDEPQHKTTLEFLKNDKFWCHAKNLCTLSELIKHKDIHTFSHDNDPVIITSKGYLWAFPGMPINSETIAVMPERVNNYSEQQLKNCKGICSDYVAHYKKRHEAQKRYAILIGGRINCADENLMEQLKANILSDDKIWFDVFLGLNSNTLKSKSKIIRNRAYCNKLFGPVILASLVFRSYIIPRKYIDFKNKDSGTSAQNTLSMYYFNKVAFKLCKKYAEKQCIEYNALMKFRPDIINSKMVDIGDVVENTVYIPKYNDWNGGINDQIAYGNMKTMEKYCTLFDTIYNNLDNVADYYLHPERMLLRHIITYKIDVQRVDYLYKLNSNRFKD